MARSIDYRSTLPFPADRVYAAMTDPEYLRARLAEIGGPGSALLDHEAGPESARYELRQGLSAQDLPPIVSQIMQGDLAIVRTESLNRDAPGRYSGDVDVTIPHAPATAAGTMTLEDAPGGSLFAVHADVTVRVPIFGGKIEDIVADQVSRLLAAETTFTADWLRTH
jgi:hypothetical protein